MKDLLKETPHFNGNITSWVTDAVTNMQHTFSGSDFNRAIGKWSVKEVGTMEGMFSNARQFNQGLSDWDVVKVLNMESMFDGALSFNQPIFNWNVARVTDISYIFRGTDALGPQFCEDAPIALFHSVPLVSWSLQCAC